MKIFSDKKNNVIPITPIAASHFRKWVSGQPDEVKAWVQNTGFKALEGTTCILPDKGGAISGVLLGISEPLQIWDCGNLARNLPKGHYGFQGLDDSDAATLTCLGWGFGTYHFDKYKTPKSLGTTLRWPDVCDRKYIERTLKATFLVRDLINTPADDMGPAELEKACRTLASDNGGRFKVIKGEQLLKQNYPAIYAIGRAGEAEPRLLDLTWGKPRDPKITLVGKGVCFDTGGLNIKSAPNMKLMKKDMGGAAHVLGLASMLMAGKAPIRLRVLIPAVENNISGNAIRPLDVVRTRSGKTVEIGHTDAEGRVILADVLFEAARQKPYLILDFATLTGAARVALGAEIPALFTNNDNFAETIMNVGKELGDPLWRLPLWLDYKRHITSKTADLTNSPDAPFGGAITAALFLQEFLIPDLTWAHIDLMAWNLSSRPGRPEGGEAMGMRAAHQAVLDWVIKLDKIK